MFVLALQPALERESQIDVIARTFGVDWVHLGAQIISFSVMCAVLYWLAYEPVLRILAARRQQIADGLANADRISAQLARIERERIAILKLADAQGQQLIEEARAAAARVQAAETQKAASAADQILVRARDTIEQDRVRMLADMRHELGRLVIQTTAAVTGKILTPEDQQRLADETTRQLTH